MGVLSAVIAALGEGGTSGLLLSPSDVDNLFPAPVSRRGVLFFKIAGRWAALLIPAVYLPLAIASTSVKAWTAPSPLAYGPGLFGVWLWMATVTNITQTVALWRLDREKDANPPSKGRENVRRVLIALVWVILLVFVYLMLGGLQNLFGAKSTKPNANPAHYAAVQTFLRAAHSQAVGIVLAPVAWASDLFAVAFRPWQWADAGRLGGLVLGFGISLWALFSRDRDFYENALDTTAKRAKVSQALRQGDAGVVLSQMAQDGELGTNRRALRPVGVGAGAILWKDLIGISRTPHRSWITLLLVAAFPAIFGVLFGRHSEIGIVAWMLTFTLQMSGFFLLGMRDMLRRADVSKALPIAPLPFIACELAASIGLQTVLGWFSLTLSGLVGMGFGRITQAAFLVFPTLAALVLFVQAIFVLLYPQKNDAAQSAVGNASALVASLVAVLPSVFAGVVLYVLRVPVLAIGAVVAVVNVGCAVGALRAASVLWRRFDPSDG